MLVLTRKAGERVLIGDDIVITILDTRGDGIRIGIDAPRGVSIQRDEIVRAVTEANVQATHASDDAEARLKAALGLGSGPDDAGDASAHDTSTPPPASDARPPKPRPGAPKPGSPAAK